MLLFQRQCKPIDNAAHKQYIHKVLLLKNCLNKNQQQYWLSSKYNDYAIHYRKKSSSYKYNNDDIF